MSSRVAFNNSYIQLPERFYSRQEPVPVSGPALIRANHPLATLLGIDPAWLESDEGVNVIAGNTIPDGAEPIATVYAGHQFGSWNPQLGDGRAVLLGEVVGQDGERYDIQLKGSGQTPYSRMGDGRAPLGPILREYIVSEAMFALGVPTSRTLAAVTTGEDVYREATLPGGVLARVAKSHIRVGTIQFFTSRQDVEGVRLLVEHVIARHYPDAAETDNPPLAMLDAIMKQQAKLIARWQMLGFIHGVMNTDNMLLSGETIDYGPCAFMDTYDPATVYSSIDHGGRYAYRNQPGIAHWNLACLAQALIPVLNDNEEEAIELAREALGRFPEYFLDENIMGLRIKLGLYEEQAEDEQLARDFLDLMEKTGADFTLAWRRLSEIAVNETGDSVSDIFDFNDEYAPWLDRWNARMAQEPIQKETRRSRMYKANPVFIPRNHLVEQAIHAATYENDLAPFHQLVELLEAPHTYRADFNTYATPPRPDEVVRQTFCGT